MSTTAKPAAPLVTHEVANQPPPLAGRNLFADDAPLQDAIAREGAGWAAGDLDQAGAFAIVLECVPEPLSKIITEKISVPTIGIGAGKYCDGQVQVISDLLGLYTDFVPKHAKQYVRLFEAIKKATTDYIAEVKAGTFPTEKQSYAMDESILAGLKKPARKSARKH